MEPENGQGSSTMTESMKESMTKSPMEAMTEATAEATTEAAMIEPQIRACGTDDSGSNWALRETLIEHWACAFSP